jgi:hypothetical protein
MAAFSGVGDAVSTSTTKVAFPWCYSMAVISAWSLPARTVSPTRFPSSSLVRDRALRGVRLVLAHDPEDLPASVVSDDRDGISDCTVSRSGHHLGAGAPCAPVAQIPSRLRQHFPVAGGLRFSVFVTRVLERAFYQRQAPPRTLSAARHVESQLVIWLFRATK